MIPERYNNLFNETEIANLITNLCKTQKNENVFVFNHTKEGPYYKHGTLHAGYGYYFIHAMIKAEEPCISPITIIDLVGNKILTQSPTVFKKITIGPLAQKDLEPQHDASKDLLKSYYEPFLQSATSKYGCFKSEKNFMKFIAEICDLQDNESVFAFGVDGDNPFLYHGVSDYSSGIFAYASLHGSTSPTTLFDLLENTIITQSPEVQAHCEKQKKRKFTVIFDSSDNMFDTHLSKFRGLFKIKI